VYQSIQPRVVRRVNAKRYAALHLRDGVSKMKSRMVNKLITRNERCPRQTRNGGYQSLSKMPRIYV
jgi:hypothetical protein